MRTPEKASDFRGAFAFPRTTKPRRYYYGGTATFHFGGYRPGLRSVVGASATAYGYTLTVGPTSMLLTHGYGPPEPLEVLLFCGGAIITALADALVGVGGVLSERVAWMVGFLICVPSKVSLVLEVLGTDEASLKDDIDYQHDQ